MSRRGGVRPASAGFAGPGNSVAGMGLDNAPAAYQEQGGMLRRLREEAGITGAALAEQLELTPTHISRMEQGKRDSTTTDVGPARGGLRRHVENQAREQLR